MNKEPVARLPLGPKDRWYEFITKYTELPWKTGPSGKVKSVEGRSSYLPLGVRISSTLSEREEIGRVSIDVDDLKRINPDLITALEGWGWKLLPQGTARMVFLKAMPKEGGPTTMPKALPLILEKLGVDPLQDWGR